MESLQGKHPSHLSFRGAACGRKQGGRCLGVPTPPQDRAHGSCTGPATEQAWGCPCWPPARLGSMEEAAFPPLPLHPDSVLFVSGAGQALLWGGHWGLRAVAEPGWPCRQEMGPGSSVEAKSLNPTQHLQIQLEAEAWCRHCRVFIPQHLPAGY